jgi:hypothetical protein
VPHPQGKFIANLWFFCYFIGTLTLSPKRHPTMYRCHFLQAGRIAQGCNLKVETLDAAIATGQKLLADRIDTDDCDGLQIWLDGALLYEFST